MNYHPFSIIPSFPTGTQLEAIQGRLTKVFGFKDGTNDHGQWSMQGGEMTDAEGKKMDVLFKNREAVPESWKGLWIFVESGEHDNRRTGLKFEQHTNPNKNVTTPRVVITASATIAFADGERPAAPPPQQQRQAPTQQRQAPPQPQRQAPPQQQRQAPQQQAGPSVYHGQTVGMAMNNAVALIKEAMSGVNTEDYFAYLASRDFSRDLHQIASDVLRVSETIQGGRLAPSVKERMQKGATSPPPQSAPPPQQQRQAPTQQQRQAPQPQNPHEPTAEETKNVLHPTDDEIPF